MFLVLDNSEWILFPFDYFLIFNILIIPHLVIVRLSFLGALKLGLWAIFGIHFPNNFGLKFIFSQKGMRVLFFGHKPLWKKIFTGINVYIMLVIVESIFQKTWVMWNLIFALQWYNNGTIPYLTSVSLSICLAVSYLQQTKRISHRMLCRQNCLILLTKHAVKVGSISAGFFFFFFLVVCTFCFILQLGNASLWQCHCSVRHSFDQFQCKFKHSFFSCGMTHKIHELKHSLHIQIRLR